MTQASESLNQQKSSESEISSQNNEISNYSKDAEQVNGRWAMIGMVALFGAYISTGQVIPGIF